MGSAPTRLELGGDTTNPSNRTHLTRKRYGVSVELGGRTSQFASCSIELVSVGTDQSGHAAVNGPSVALRRQLLTTCVRANLNGCGIELVCGLAKLPTMDTIPVVDETLMVDAGPWQRVDE